MSDSLGPPPKAGDVNRAPTILGVHGALGLLCVLCAVARIYTRVRLLRAPGADDAIILFCVILVVANFGMLVKATTFGLGRHAYYLTTENYLLSIKWFLLNHPIGIINIALAKLAVVIFLSRVMGPTKRYQIGALYFFVITLIILTAVFAILVFAQCSPPSASWKPNIPHSCWNPKILENYSFFVGAYSAFNDLVLAVFPATVIFKLQMSRERKLGISFLMSLGVVACVCATVRTTKTEAPQSLDDGTWRIAELMIWTVAEIDVVIICACIPILPPLVQQLSGKKDYLSRRKPGFNEQAKDFTDGSKRSLWNDILLRPVKLQGAIDKNEDRERSLPEGEIRTTTEVQTQWEVV